MGAKLTPETEDEIVGMYVMAGKGGVEIATHIGCDLTTVYNVLRRNGIEIRRPGYQPTELDEQAICMEYAEVKAGRIPRKELLVRYAISDAMLRALLKRNGIRTPDEEIADVRKERQELVVQAYQQDWPVTKIAAAFDVTLPTIYVWIKQAGVELRKVKTAAVESKKLEDLRALLEFERNKKLEVVAAIEAKETGGEHE